MTNIVEQLKKELEGFSAHIDTERIGRVTRVADGIVEIEGLSTAMMSEMLVFDATEGKSIDELMTNADAPLAMVLNLESVIIKAIVLGKSDAIREGMVVRSTGNILSIPVGEELVGRVVTPLGEPQDGGVSIKAVQRNPLERKAYGVIDRATIDAPLHTGIKAIDGMVPIGRGQRELIIGDRQTGKTVIAIDTIINQKHEPKERRPICIYVAIGQKDAKVARLVQKLRDEGAMEYSIVVSASSSASAALQFLAPYAGAAIGEYFMDQGKDAVVVYDDLSKHAVAYRQLSLLLRRPPGREAYPGDIFYLHSRLLERSAKLSTALKGGSLTALPIIETQEGDVSAYIPTNVISITDGQIYLEADLFNKGVRPGINVGISVSRVGSKAQTKAMKKVAGRLRLELAQFRELEAFAQFSQDLDDETKKRLERGRLLVDVLKQDKNVPIPFERQVVSIYVATSGLLDRSKKDNVVALLRDFIAFVDRQHGTIFQTIGDTRELTIETESLIAAAMTAFTSDRPEYFIPK